jgi:methionyl-tRNA synthetase
VYVAGWCGYDSSLEFTPEALVTAIPPGDGISTSAPQSAAPPKPPVVTYEQFAQLDLRVARIVEAREHPNANKLLLLKIRIGEVEKQIVAGIRGHYEPAALVGRLIAVVNNLAPAVIRGEESNGMLLAASDGAAVILLQPEREIADGSRIK